MMLIDSNIIIYAAQPAHSQLRRFIAEHVPAVSAISYVEVLGYHQLDNQDRQYFEQFFYRSRVFPCRKPYSTKRLHYANSGGCLLEMLSSQEQPWRMI